jgi:hypothetical protein
LDDNGSLTAAADVDDEQLQSPQLAPLFLVDEHGMLLCSHAKMGIRMTGKQR